MILKFNSYIKESFNSKPQLKFPTDKAAHFNYLIFILKKAGINPSRLFVRENERAVDFQDFCFEKCNKPILYPLVREIDVNPQLKLSYSDFIFRDSVFLLPASYDSKNDYADHIERRISFLIKAVKTLKQSGAGKEDIEDFENKFGTHVDFGPNDYSKVNPALDIIYQEFKDYYVDGKLRVYNPETRDSDGYVGFDYPHKYKHEYLRPNGVIFLSELEKWLDENYGLKDDQLYEFIVNNRYIEGRYWERVLSFDVEDDDETKLKRENFGKYGMEPTKTILKILDVIENEFEVQGNPYEGFPVFVDYYKHVKPNY